MKWLPHLVVAATPLLLAACTERRDTSPQPTSSVDDGAAHKGTPLLTLTPRAAAKVKEIIASTQPTGPVYLRVRAVGGGCSGFMHKLDLEPELGSDDQVFETAGVKVVVAKMHIEWLEGAVVDYVTEKDKEGFKIDNPRADARLKAIAEKEKKSEAP